MAKEKGSGIQQQAGLVRYFDTDNDKALKISPKFVIGLAILVSAIVLLLQVFRPM